MLKIGPTPERMYLGFAEEALKAFDFLTKEYGFRCVKAEPTFVRYESPHVYINVYHGRASYELGVEIGRFDMLHQEEYPFSISDVMALNVGLSKTNYKPVQVSTAEGVSAFVPKLAEYVSRYAGPVLQGDASTFKQLSKVRSERAIKTTKEIEMSQVRNKANEAWHKKNYAKLIELYEPVQDALTPAEIKKLEFARKNR